MALNEMAVRATGGVTSDGGAVHSCVQSLLAEIGEHSRKSVVDVGAGVGNFTKVLLERFGFARVVAVDYMEAPAELHQRCDWRRADLNEAIPLESQAIDIACAIEVIEHLENPRHFVRELHRILTPGGIAIITTPNNLSLRSKISYLVRGYFTCFGDQDYPAHISPILHIDMVRMLKEAGFGRIEHRHTDWGDIPGTKAWKWQKLSPALKGIHFSDSFITLAVRT
jgi:SAM-dependent methyltransferase